MIYRYRESNKISNIWLANLVSTKSAFGFGLYNLHELDSFNLVSLNFQIKELWIALTFKLVVASKTWDLFILQYKIQPLKP